MQTSSSEMMIHTNSKPFTGLHIVANLKSTEIDLLINPQPLQQRLAELLDHYGLTSVGEVYHTFPEAGYTAIVGLTESHLSIHTWPEHQYITFDVFISNHSKDNAHITEKLYRAIVQYFQATVLEEQFIHR
jgi:S-adenosylmethionine decarboxylase